MIRRRLWPKKATPLDIAAEAGCLSLSQGNNTLTLPLELVEALIHKIQTVRGIHAELNPISLK